MERVLSLDISSKTGWALLISSPSGFSLEAYGQIPQIAKPISPYPCSFVDWAYMCFGAIVQLVDRFAPNVLVIEETSGGSKSSHSQKILEFIHFLVAKMIKETGIKAVYYLTEQWRRLTGCKMTKEESMHNKAVTKYKAAHNNTKIAKDSSGKRIGKKTRKHINVRRANEIFGEFLIEPLRKKDEDTADALLLGQAYHLSKEGL